MKILFAITNLYKETGGSYRAFIETVRAVYNKNVDIKIIYLKDEINKNNISIPETYKGIDIIHFFGGWDYFSIKLIFIFQSSKLQSINIGVASSLITARAFEIIVKSGIIT